MSNLLGYVIPVPGKLLELVKADLTDEHVDVIVNAANQWLQHGAGVAGAIILKGGAVIQKESNEWVAKHGPISADRPAYTTAGKLTCHYVIHAVGPVWGEGEEEKKLYRAVRGALNLAVQLKARTLSMPPISTGIFGFPKETAAPIFYHAINDFWLAEPDCLLNKVRIAIIDTATSSVFLNALDQWKKEDHTDDKNGF
jgi:O-acetyl-ADP-ribose deacetylase